MVRIEVKKNSQWYELDVLDMPMSINYRLDDIKDLTKKKNSYTKTILFPGTERNIQFLEGATEINVNLDTFNVKAGFPTRIYSEDQLVFEGDLIFTKINKTGEYKNTIEGMVTSPLKTLDEMLAGRFLNDLQSLNKYCHTRTRQAQIDSWDNKVFIEKELTQSDLGVGYVYPLIIKGNNNPDFSQFTYFFDLDPAVYVKTIVDSIFDDINITYKSNFFNTEYFKRLIIPFGGNNIEIDEEGVLEKTTIVGKLNVSDILPMSVVTSWMYTDTLIVDGTTVIKPYHLPLERTTGQVLDDGEELEFTDISGQWDNLDNIMTIEESGYYDINLTLHFFLRYLPQREDKEFRYNNNGGTEWRWNLQKHNGTQWVNIARSNDYGGQGQYGILFAQPSTDSEQPPGVWIDYGTPLTVPVIMNNYWLNAGDRLRFRIGIKRILPNNGWRVGGLLTNNRVRVGLSLAPDHMGSVSKFQIKPSTTAGYGNEDICMNSIVPKERAFDFLLNIIKMFNLIIVKEDEHWLIEPYDDYHRTKPKVKDWNHKIDMELYDIRPMSEVNFNEWTFKYKSDKDWLNEDYEEEFNETYGTKIVKLDNIYSNKRGSLEVSFSPTPVTNLDEEDIRVAPFFMNSELKSQTVNTRILFWGGKKPGVFRLRDQVEDFNDIIFNEYPYCGMWDDPYNPKWDLAFGLANRLYYDVNVQPLNNLFNSFHRKSFLSIIDNNAKLLTGLFDLNAYDIKDFDFRDTIFLFGEYWRVNLIEDYDPTTPKLTRVELYKIVNQETYLPTVTKIPGQNVCPTDIVVSFQGSSKMPAQYRSLSGTSLTQECCSALGGHWNGQICLVDLITPDSIPWIDKPVIPTNPTVTVKGPYTPGRTMVPTNTLVRSMTPGATNKPGTTIISKPNDKTIDIRSNRPYDKNPWTPAPSKYTGGLPATSLIDEREWQPVRNVSIGRNNINTHSKSLVIGDNQVSPKSETINIGGTYIDKDGIDKKYNLIDSGRDVVRPIYSPNPEYAVVYSGRDEVRSLCYFYPFEIIDPNLDTDSNYQ